MDELTQKITKRLVISAIAFAIFTALSTVAFYYFHAKAPLVPLIFGVMAWPAMAIILMSWHDLRSIKAKKDPNLDYGQ